VGGRDLIVTMPRNWRKTAKIQVAFDSPVRAPVSRGATLGRLSVSGQGVPNMEVPLLAGADVPKLGLPGRAAAVLAHYVGGS
ncbi:MAG TPA: D-alanyl-D-alanine carboxypeptidase, partial [Acetobacteraceae bacterium]|nr:D-alanyl-D-alanine carboxypeptidase [Acetobacteraceae bacterium]